MNEILKDIITDIKRKAIKKEFINSLLNAYYDYVYEILDEEFYAVYNGIDEEDDDARYITIGTALLAKSRKNAVFMRFCRYGRDENIPKLYQLMVKENQ